MGIVARMSDAIHLQIYQRFFAVLFSVIPGLNLIVGLAIFMLWLFADVLEVDWGVGVGVAGVAFSLGFVVWVFVGLAVQKWAEQKSTGLLFGLCLPFLAFDAVLTCLLLWQAIFAEHEEEASGAGMLIIRTLTMVG